MAEGKGGVRGCLKAGTFGCVGCVTVGLVVFLVLAAIGLSLGVPDADFEQQQVARELPPDPSRDASGRAALQPSELRAQGISGRPRDIVPPRAGRVVLDLSMGEFIVEPGPPGEPIRIEADYDTASFDLEETLTEDDDGWTYRIEFGSSISAIRRMFKIQNIENKVKIILPRGVPFALEGSLGIGESRLELGGLWLTDVDLETSVGEHGIGFDEPLFEPIERFRIDGSTGELRIRGVGHASPSDVWVHQNIGELVLDLTGDWQRDANVRAGLRIGDLSVRVPDDVNIDVAKSSLSIGERHIRGFDRSASLEDAPTLRLSLSQFIGEMSVRD